MEDIANLNETLLNREKYADSILEANNLNNTSLQNNLLSFLNTQDDITILEFSEPHEVVQEDSKIVSYSFTLKGDYNQMLNTLYTLEQDYNFGEVKYVGFERKRDFRSRKDYLMVSIVISNFKGI